MNKTTLANNLWMDYVNAWATKHDITFEQAISILYDDFVKGGVTYNDILSFKAGNDFRNDLDF